MKTQANLFAAVLAVGGFAAIGCDNKDAPTVTETKTTTADKANDAAHNVADAARDAGHNVADAARDAGHNVADTARNMNDGATTMPAGMADGGVVAEVTDLYNKATAAISAQKLDDAQGYINKIKTYRDKVPAEWQGKIDQLVSTFDAAKARLNSLPNVNMPH